MKVLKENERMREDDDDPQIFIAAENDKRGRNHKKGDYGGRSRS